MLWTSFFELGLKLTVEPADQEIHSQFCDHTFRDVVVEELEKRQMARGNESVEGRSFGYGVQDTGYI